MSNALSLHIIEERVALNVQRGEVYRVNLGEGIDTERSGETLILILQNNTGNRYSSTTIGVVLTDKSRNLPTHIEIPNSEEIGLDKKTTIALEQIRVFSKERITNPEPICKIDLDQFLEPLLLTLGLDGLGSFSNKYQKIFRGDIFYVDLGKGLSSEQGGKRPCLVISNDVGNYYSPNVIIVPITSSIKDLPTHSIIEDYMEYGLNKKSQICFEQIRTISKKRILWDKPIGNIDVDQFKDVLLMSLGFQQKK